MQSPPLAALQKIDRAPAVICILKMHLAKCTGFFSPTGTTRKAHTSHHIVIIKLITMNEID
jgi:hypothetical protein